VTPWQWWAAAVDEVDSCGEWQLGEFASRDAAVAAANREYPPGTAFYVVEARSSTNMKYEGADIVPFVRQRHKEQLVTALHPYLDLVGTALVRDRRRPEARA
jgi:hypothetical protein